MRERQKDRLQEREGGPVKKTGAREGRQAGKIKRKGETLYV